MWKYRDEYIKIFLSFTNFSISGDELLESIEDSRTVGEIDENQLRARIEEAISMIQKQIKLKL